LEIQFIDFWFFVNGKIKSFTLIGGMLLFGNNQENVTGFGPPNGWPYTIKF